jgi:hypothetical protein
MAATRIANVGTSKRALSGSRRTGVNDLHGERQRVEVE